MVKEFRVGVSNFHFDIGNPDWITISLVQANQQQILGHESLSIFKTKIIDNLNFPEIYERDATMFYTLIVLSDPHTILLCSISKKDFVDLHRVDKDGNRELLVSLSSAEYNNFHRFIENL